MSHRSIHTEPPRPGTTPGPPHLEVYVKYVFTGHEPGRVTTVCDTEVVSCRTVSCAPPTPDPSYVSHAYSDETRCTAIKCGIAVSSAESSRRLCWLGPVPKGLAPPAPTVSFLHSHPHPPVIFPRYLCLQTYLLPPGQPLSREGRYSRRISHSCHQAVRIPRGLCILFFCPHLCQGSHTPCCTYACYFNYPLHPLHPPTREPCLSTAGSDDFLSFFPLSFISVAPLFDSSLHQRRSVLHHSSSS